MPTICNIADYLPHSCDSHGCIVHCSYSGYTDPRVASSLTWLMSWFVFCWTPVAITMITSCLVTTGDPGQPGPYRWLGIAHSCLHSSCLHLAAIRWLNSAFHPALPSKKTYLAIRHPPLPIRGGVDGRVVKVLDSQPRDRGFESRHTLGLLCLKSLGKICTPNVPWGDR